MLISENQAANFIEAVKHLQSLGFERIQCEFGPTGFLALSAVPSVEAYLSSEKLSGIEIFTSRHGVEFRVGFIRRAIYCPHRQRGCPLNG
jgi:hypothetical protein